MVIWQNGVEKIWWNGEGKISIVKLILWYLIVSWVLNSYVVSLYFIQYANNGNPDDFGETYLYYLWLLLIYLLFYTITFLSFPMKM